jgi:hypothetical protein
MSSREGGIDLPVQWTIPGCLYGRLARIGHQIIPLSNSRLFIEFRVENRSERSIWRMKCCASISWTCLRFASGLWRLLSNSGERRSVLLLLSEHVDQTHRSRFIKSRPNRAAFDTELRMQEKNSGNGDRSFQVTSPGFRSKILNVCK